MKPDNGGSYGMLAFAWGGLRLHPLRSLVAILTIAVTLAASLTLIGVSESLESAVVDGYAARRVDLIVMQAGKTNPLTSRLEASSVERLRSIDLIERVQPLLVDSLLLNADRSVLVYGWEPDHPDLLRGSSDGENGLAVDEVLIGHTASILTGLGRGDDLELNLSNFRIAGVFEADSFYESGVLFMRLDALQGLIGADGKVTFVFLELQPGLSDSVRGTLVERIEGMIPAAQVVSADAFVRENQMTSALRGLSRIILVTNTTLGALIVSTIMVQTVSERRHDIAVLRAIGWSSARIARLVVYETAALATIAALLGAAIGWLSLAAALGYLMQLGFYAESVLTPMLLTGAIIAVVLVALLGSAIPVYHALGIRVAEALRSG